MGGVVGDVGKCVGVWGRSGELWKEIWGVWGRLPVISPHGNFATETSSHGNFATLSESEG